MSSLVAPAAPRRINAYVCDGGYFQLPGLPRACCDHFIITVDRDEGVTPFMVSCENCGRPAYSKMYRVAVDITPTHEWYRPTADAKLSDWEAAHVDKGGLLLRPIEGRGRWLHPNALRVPELIAEARSAINP